MEYFQLFVTIILILIIFYISNIIKKKQDAEIKKKQNSVKQGDNIITYTGLSGEVSEVLEDRVILKINPSMIEISIEKWAIAGIDERKNTKVEQ